MGGGLVSVPTSLTASPAQQEQRDARVSGRPATKDTRSAGRRDRDKILYAPALQRLVGVTQVVTPQPGGALTHNRLTHSLKVAQVARSIAESLLAKPEHHAALASLGGLDADVAEAAGLAHDIGHPPFGHIGEAILDDFGRNTLRLWEGFEGNAQTFRIVARLDARRDSYTGMDLTAATMSAVLKYPWQRNPREEDDQRHEDRAAHDPEYSLKSTKYGFYEEERRHFEHARRIDGVAGEMQSVEAAIMDLADDVTYALHDLQDFYMARVLPVPLILERLKAYHDLAKLADGPSDIDEAKNSAAATFASLGRKLRKSYPNRFDHELFVQAVGNVRADVELSFLPYFDAVPSTTANVSRFVSVKIGRLTRDLIVNTSPTGELPAVHLQPPQWHEVQVLKHLTNEQVVGRPDMAVYQRAQQAVLRDLLEAMGSWVGDPHDWKRLPQPLLEWGQRAADEGRSPDRCLIDYVASLSDHQALSLHRALRGGGQGIVGALVL